MKQPLFILFCPSWMAEDGRTGLAKGRRRIGEMTQKNGVKRFDSPSYVDVVSSLKGFNSLWHKREREREREGGHASISSSTSSPCKSRPSIWVKAIKRKSEMEGKKRLPTGLIRKKYRRWLAQDGEEHVSLIAWASDHQGSKRDAEMMGNGPRPSSPFPVTWPIRCLPLCACVCVCVRALVEPLVGDHRPRFIQLLCCCFFHLSSSTFPSPPLHPLPINTHVMWLLIKQLGSL